MVKCNGMDTEGAPCDRILYECRRCGYVGCFPSHGCEYSLRSADDHCKGCGTDEEPAKYIPYGNVNEQFFYPTVYKE